MNILVGRWKATFCVCICRRGGCRFLTISPNFLTTSILLTPCRGAGALGCPGAWEGHQDRAGLNKNADMDEIRLLGHKYPAIFF